MMEPDDIDCGTKYVQRENLETKQFWASGFLKLRNGLEKT
jgi:hypothetical protein